MTFGRWWRGQPAIKAELLRRTCRPAAKSTRVFLSRIISRLALATLCCLWINAAVTRAFISPTWPCHAVLRIGEISPPLNPRSKLKLVRPRFACVFYVRGPSCGRLFGQNVIRVGRIENFGMTNASTRGSFPPSFHIFPFRFLFPPRSLPLPLSPRPAVPSSVAMLSPPVSSLSSSMLPTLRVSVSPVVASAVLYWNAGSISESYIIHL